MLGMAAGGMRHGMGIGEVPVKHDAFAGGGVVTARIDGSAYLWQGYRRSDVEDAPAPA